MEFGCYRSKDPAFKPKSNCMRAKHLGYLELGAQSSQSGRRPRRCVALCTVARASYFSRIRYTPVCRVGAPLPFLQPVLTSSPACLRLRWEWARMVLPRCCSISNIRRLLKAMWVGAFLACIRCSQPAQSNITGIIYTVYTYGG